MEAAYCLQHTYTFAFTFPSLMRHFTTLWSQKDDEQCTHIDFSTPDYFLHKRRKGEQKEESPSNFKALIILFSSQQRGPP